MLPANGTSPTRPLPKDASVIQSMLKDLGITDYEPAVVNQILEFSYRYVVSILEEAKVYSSHAGKTTIDVDDLRVAVMMQADKLFCAPPQRDLMLEMARTRNAMPLPLIKDNKGVRLPPDRYCLVAPNRRFVGAKREPPRSGVDQKPVPAQLQRAAANYKAQGPVMFQAPQRQQR